MVLTRGVAMPRVNYWRPFDGLGANGGVLKEGTHFTCVERVVELLEVSESGRLVSTTAVVVRV